MLKLSEQIIIIGISVGSKEVFLCYSDHEKPISKYIPGDWEDVIAKLHKVVTDKQEFELRQKDI